MRRQVTNITRSYINFVVKFQQCPDTLIWNIGVGRERKSKTIIMVSLSIANTRCRFIHTHKTRFFVIVLKFICGFIGSMITNQTFNPVRSPTNRALTPGKIHVSSQ
jgi:hypothetical protein